MVIVLQGFHNSSFLKQVYVNYESMLEMVSNNSEKSSQQVSTLCDVPSFFEDRGRGVIGLLPSITSDQTHNSAAM